MKIRYRVWDPVSKTMDDWNHYVDSDGDVFFDGNGGLEPCDNLTTMLSTGLNDCDGKEIFEGDIVDIGGDEKIIDFNGLGFNLFSPRLGFILCPLSVVSNDLDIIKITGNIYENQK